MHERRIKTVIISNQEDQIHKRRKKENVRKSLEYLKCIINKVLELTEKRHEIVPSSKYSG